MKYFSLVAILLLLQLSSITAHTFYFDARRYHTHNDAGPNYALKSGMRPSHNVHFSSIPNLSTYSVEQLKNYFTNNRYTEKEILSQYTLYMSDEFVHLAKTLPGYQETITALYQQFSATGFLTHCKVAWIKTVEFLSGNYCSGLQKRINRLYNELPDKKYIQKQPDSPVVNNHYVEKLAMIPKAYAGTRTEALLQTYVNPEKRIIRSIAIEYPVIACAEAYGITKENLLSGSMNAYEYQLHTEFVDQLTQLTDLINIYHCPRGSNLFVDALGKGIALGIETNKHKEPVIATQWADFGWEVLEVIKGIGEGVVLGAFNTAHFITNAACYPISTIQDVAHGLGTMVRAAGNIIGISIHHETLCLMGKYEQSYQDAHKMWEESQQISQACLTQLAEMSRRDIAKHATACATDWVLVGKALTLAHSICSRAGPLLVEALEVLSKEPSVEYAVVGAEGMILKMSETAKHTSGAVAEVIKDSRLILETFHAEFVTQLAPQIVELRKLFDCIRKGFAEFANKYIKIPYEHVLGFDLSFSKKGKPKLGGFHHDWMQCTEQKKVLQLFNKTIYENGFYKADIFYEGIKIKEEVTFFPSHWPRKKVIEKIYEAYDNFIKSEVEPFLESNQKYKIQGLIDEGIEIEMCITKKGEMVTAYPLLK